MPCHGPSTSHLSRVGQLAGVIHYTHSLQMGRESSGFCHTKRTCHAQAGTEQADLDRLEGWSRKGNDVEASAPGGWWREE